LQSVLFDFWGVAMHAFAHSVTVDGLLWQSLSLFHFWLLYGHSGDNQSELHNARVSLVAKYIVVRAGTNESSGDVTARGTPPVPHGAKRRRVEGEGPAAAPSTSVGARWGKKPTASGATISSGGGTAGPSGDGDIVSEDAGFGDDGFLVIEPMHAKLALGARYLSWKDRAEQRLELMRSQITELFQYSSTVLPARVTGRGAAADARTSCATIRLEEKTVLQFPRPKKVHSKSLLLTVKMLRKALRTGDADLDAKVIVHEGWTG
jgi:hypothetical protein